MAVASVLLTLLSLVLGVVCRYNFGKGLLRYQIHASNNTKYPKTVEVQQKLPDGDFRYYERSEEKVEFPLNEKLIPTFAAAFGQGSEISQPRIFQGPRSFNSSIKYFESGRNSPPHHEK
ncbi:hypothetical protein C0992_007612 [Termitomyces sp. T32_za158]|nr:hypothetical protein C0992_007612 [Termitomyces sp. T32_za158]